MIPDDPTALRARAAEVIEMVEAATPGPWFVGPFDCGDYVAEHVGSETDTITGELHACTSDADARLIAAAPGHARELAANLSALADERERAVHLTAENAHLSGELDGACATVAEMESDIARLTAERDEAVREHERIARRLDSVEASNAAAIDSVISLRATIDRLRPVVEALTTWMERGAAVRDTDTFICLVSRSLRCDDTLDNVIRALRALLADAPAEGARMQQVVNPSTGETEWARKADLVRIGTVADLNWKRPSPRQTAAEFMAEHRDDPGGLLAAGSTEVPDDE